jgi:hypothetical protein
MDLARCDSNFYSGRVGGLQRIRQLPGRLNDGKVLEYVLV